MPTRVVLHVGVPHSGGEFVRAAVGANATQLQRDGWSTAPRPVMRRTPGRSTFGPLLAHVRTHRSQHHLVLLGQYGPETSEQAARLTGDLQSIADVQVDVVVTARPLADQIPQVWRRRLIRGSSDEFPQLFSRLVSAGDDQMPAWLDPAVPIERWCSAVGADHVHVAVSRHRDDATLWQHVNDLLGRQVRVDEISDVHTGIDLGPDGAELCRRINAIHDGRLLGRWRQPWVEALFSGDVLRGRDVTAVMRMPDSCTAQVDAWADHSVDRIVASGCRVLGDLGDLRRPSWPERSRPADQFDPAVVEDLTRWTIGRLQEWWVQLSPQRTPPDVGMDDGVRGLVDLMEHCRAASTHTTARPGDPRRTKPARRWFKLPR